MSATDRKPTVPAKAAQPTPSATKAEGATDTHEGESAAPTGSFGKLTPREAAIRSAEVRREKAERRAEDAESNALTFRQRLGVSLSKLSQGDLDKRVKDARPAELVRFADQAFGKPREAEEDVAEDDLLAGLTREQRAVVREWAAQGDDAPAQGT